MKRIITLVAIATLLLNLNGCGSKPGAPETKLPADMPGGGGAAGGGPPPPGQRPTVAMGGGGGASTPAPAAGAAQPPADQAAQQPPPNISATGNVPRNLPRMAMGGGGGASSPAPAATGPATTNPSAGNIAGLANGLYPQGVTGGGVVGGGGTTIAGGLVNGLYPQFGGGGSSAPTSAASNPGTPIATASSALAGDSNDAAAKQASAAGKLLDEAKELYAAGDDDAAAKSLYAYLLAKEDAFEDYPLEWYPGLKEPRAFLRMGIGVTYNRPRDFDGKPPVIGDPVADSRGGRRQGAPPTGDGDVIGSSGASGGPTGAASNSPYNTVDTTTPAGFLLYYTGDYVEKLYQELNSRRKGSKAQFGKILAQFPERAPTKPAAQGDAAQAPPAAPQSGPPANRPTIQMGGGGGAPAGAPTPAAGGGAPASGGGNQNASTRNPKARKLVELWSGSDASPPERLTTGSLMPGVTCLGEGKKEEIFSRAKKFGVDVVLIFDVRVGEAKGENYTTTTLRLFDPDNPEEQLALGRQLRNNVVMESRDAGRDPVDGELARVIDEYIDQNLAATKLPDSLNQENVAKRIETILAGEIEHPLKAAVEVIGFYRVGLLPEDKVTAALNQLLGEDLAEAILNGEESDRVAGLRKIVESD